MWRVRRTSLAYQNIWWCTSKSAQQGTRILRRQSRFFNFAVWVRVCKLYDDILYILLSKILYDVTSSTSTSSLGIMSYCTAVDNRKNEKAWYKSPLLNKVTRAPSDTLIGQTRSANPSHGPQKHLKILILKCVKWLCFPHIKWSFLYDVEAIF